MNRRYMRSHFSDQAMDRSIISNNSHELGSSAELLADIAEYDARKRYRLAGYPSMFEYCVRHLRRSEPAAYKRIRVARAARRFPVIFDAIAEGRLHLSGVVLLAPHLTEHTAEDLLAAAENKSLKQIEQLLAERFPRPDVPTIVTPLPVPGRPPGPDELTLRSVGETQKPAHGLGELTLRSVEGPPMLPMPPMPPQVERCSSLKPLAPQRYALQVTIDQETHDALCYAQELLSHELPSGDVSKVLAMALQALIPQLEKRKFAATNQPRPRRGSSENPRYIPPDVQRAVWERDRGQCTFVGGDGRRCEARKFIEFDHVKEVARGGEATVDGIRLLCRAHNQYAAERTFGSEFMRHKRIAAAEARGAAKQKRIV